MAVLPMLVRQHAEDAAFLFGQRSRAFHGQSWDEVQLGRCDQRIEANIAGLVAAGTTGLEIAAEYAQTLGGAGEVFALAMTAFAQGRAIGLALASGLASSQGRRGLSGALARTDATVIGPQVRPWLDSAEAGLRLLGLMALSHHRRDPGAALTRYLSDPSPEVRSRAARLAFELGRADLAGPLGDLAERDAEDVWPAIALARFGKAPGRVYDHAALPGRVAASLALDVALIAAPGEARERLGAMLRQPQTRALALSRAGVTGDLSVAAWLWQRLDEEGDAEAALFALFDLYPIDPDLCGQLAGNPARPVRVEDWLAARAADSPHLSLRRRMLDTLRSAFRDPRTVLPDWRKTRAYPAWS